MPLNKWLYNSVFNRQVTSQVKKMEKVHIKYQRKKDARTYQI